MPSRLGTHDAKNKLKNSIWKILSHTQSQSAPGLDIDLKMANGERIIGEVKTTTPCQKGLLGANQKDSIEKDLKKLEDTPANHKYFFVTDPGTYAQVQNQMPQGVEIILLR